MNKTFNLVIALAILTLCFSGLAYAEDLAGRFSVGAVAGGVFPKDSDIDNSAYFGGNLAYGINDYFAVGAEVGYTSWNDEEGGIDYGDVRAIPFLADVYLRYPMDFGENKIVPYGVGGIGVIFWDYEESSLLKDNGINVNMDPELGFKLGGGVDYFLTKNFALNCEASYLWSDADISVVAFGSQAAATIDTDAWMVNAGLKYYFD